MVHSVLLCIGIDEYQDRTIPPLAYCVADCYRVERVFNVFHLADTFIGLTNQDATREKILNALHALPRHLAHLYLYYSAHGKALKQRSYLYAYDTYADKIADTGLALALVIDTLLSRQAHKITLILDACEFIKPPILDYNLTILHPRTECTYEETALLQSVFTHDILATFSRENHYQFTGKKTPRYQRIRQDLANLLANENLAFIRGKAGVGKSHLLRRIKSHEPHTYYVSLPQVDGLTVEVILSLLNEAIALASHNPYEKFIDADPARYLRFYAYSHPYSLLIIDHVDHLSALALKKLLRFLQELPLQKIVASRHAPAFVPPHSICDFPVLTRQDRMEALREMGITNPALIDQESMNRCDTYIQLLHAVYQHQRRWLPLSAREDIRAIRQAKQALAVAGGFIHQTLFVETFRLKPAAITQLLQTGLLVFYADFYYPHDAVYEETSEWDLARLQKTACAYWKKEIKKNPTSTKAVQSLILLAQVFSLNFKPEETEIYRAMISAMQGRQNTHFLLLLTAQLKEETLNLDLRLFLCESLIEIGQFEAANAILLRHPTFSIELATLAAELDWWQGKFRPCIRAATALLAKQPAMTVKLRLLCSRGIGYFFLGQWEHASQDLETVINNKNISDEKILYLSYCVLATIQGLRGTHFAASVDNFICALNYAKRARKLSWLALIDGNVGEMLWKAGYYAQSIALLTLASHLAYLTDNVPLHLEINRNLLHAYHRSHQQSAETLQLKKLEALFNEQSDNYVKMQIVNTLITHYIFAGKQKYRAYLALAQRLTQHNAEYRIYTLSNMALAKLAQHRLNSALTTMQKALKLCLSGKNWLAMKQCLDDWDETIAAHRLPFPVATQAFQTWRQMLETTLLPSLHHLSRLCEYLELP